MTNKEMAVELSQTNRILQALSITSTYDNLVKLASVMESIDRVISVLNEKPEPPEPAPAPEAE